MDLTGNHLAMATVTWIKQFVSGGSFGYAIGRRIGRTSYRHTSSKFLKTT